MTAQCWNLDLENLGFASVVSRLVRLAWRLRRVPMSNQRVQPPVSETTETATVCAIATRSVQHRKILVLGTFATLLVAIAVPVLFTADRPSVAANSTLKCYDRAGNDEPCGTRAGAAPPRLNGRANVAHRTSWITTALYHPETWQAPALDQAADGTTNAPAARRSIAPRKRLALAVCRRRFIPCFFSALRKGVTHLASVAATVGQARPVREHL